MSFKTKITLTFIFTIFLSCSSEPDDDITPSEPDDDITPIDSEIVTITPGFGYEGDEIIFEMSNPIPSNANVSVTYNGQSAVVNFNGTTIKHIVPNNPESSIILTINGQETYIDNPSDFKHLKKYIDCENCREKAFVPSNDLQDLPTENILDINKINNTVYLIKTKYSQNSNETNTSLIKTDLDFNIIEENTLFNGLPNSNILFEDNNFIIQRDFDLVSYNYSGNLLWSYNISNLTIVSSYKNSIVKFNSNYYLYKNAIPVEDATEPIEILKIDNGGQLITTINIPISNTTNYWNHNGEFLTVLNNNIVGITSLDGNSSNDDTDAYFVIDNNNNILKNSLTSIDLPYSNLFVEGNSIYYNDGNSYPNPNSPELKKISLDINNNLNIDWTRQDNGIIVKHNNKYLMFLPENDSGYYNDIKIFNDNNFSDYDFIDIEGVRYGDNAKVFANEVYLFGNRPIFSANDSHALIGRYDLNNIIN